MVAGDRGIPILEIGRHELDRMTGGVLHQGIGLQVPPFAYENFDDLIAAALEQTAPLLVALDGVTDPRNVGAVIRSVAAFGGHGVFMTERRAAGITATAWRTSAGAAARVPVAQVVNLTRAIKAALDRIEAESPALGAHLRTTVRTGTFCSYTPDPRAPITWAV